MMKFALLFCFALTLFCTTIQADTATYLAEHPLFEVAFPEGWKVESVEQDFYAYPAEDNFMFWIWPIKEAETMEQALEAINASIGEKLSDLVMDEPFEMEYNGITFYSTIVTGTYGESTTKMTIGVFAFSPDGKNFIAITIYATPQVWQKSEDMVLGVIKSIKLIPQETTEEAPTTE